MKPRCLFLSWPLLVLLLVSGCSSVQLVKPAVIGDPPYAEFEFEPLEPVVGQVIRFEASDGGLVSSFSQPQSYRWDFGDGFTGEGRSTTHSYAYPDAYTATLTTVNREGLEASISKTLRVNPISPPATPDFPYSFGAGLRIVGTDIEAGTYRTQSAGRNCFWERLSGLDGTIDQIVAKAFNDGPAIVTIAGKDRAFNSRGCARWTQDLSPITADPNAPFGQGVYRVGVDISPGIWQARHEGSCYWRRLGGFGWTAKDVIEAGFDPAATTVVLIEASDKGFESSQCGTWTKF